MRIGESYVRLAFVLGLLAVVLTVLQHIAWEHGHRSVPERLVISALSPAVTVLSRGATGINDVVLSLANAGTLRRENALLRDECSRLKADRLRMADLAAENSELRRELGSPLPPGVKRICVAQVIGRTPGLLRRRLTIRAAPGVKLAKDDIVLQGGCLAGRLLDAVGPRGEAVLLVDSEHAVAGVDLRSRDQGMLYAEPPSGGQGDLLRMDKIVGHSDLAAGDVILTSGIGQAYPRGVPIGTVVAVTASSAGGGVVSALVRPYVDFDRAEFLTVVRMSGGQQ